MGRVRVGVCCIGLATALAACGPDAPPLVRADAGALDAGWFDAGSADAGAYDAGLERDAGPADAGAGDDDDAGLADAGSFDAGSVDAGAYDAGLDADAGPGDAGVGDDDAGSADAGWLDAGAGDDAGLADAGYVYVDQGDGGTMVVRLLAGNLSSGTHQSYDPGEGIRILQGLAPDVAMIQEFNDGTNSAADLRAMVDLAFGPEFSFVRGPSDQQIPNGVVSRFPILASGDWVDPRVGNRDFVWAKIALPSGQNLIAVSVHLLTSSATNRGLEASALVSALQQNAAPDDLIAVGGDFNTDSRAERAISNFGAILSTAPPYPVDQSGDGNTNANRSKPYDWVLVGPALRALEVPLQIGANGFGAGLVFDSRVYSPMIDVAPAQVGDSDAVGMQHMAVMRAFEIAN